MACVRCGRVDSKCFWGLVYGLSKVGALGLGSCDIGLGRVLSLTL